MTDLEVTLNNDPVTVTTLVVVGPPGPQGPPGSGAALVHEQTIASASWSFSHSLGRLPIVDIYVAGVRVIADITVTTTTVSVVFASPFAGTAVVT